MPIQLQNPQDFLQYCQTHSGHCSHLPSDSYCGHLGSTSTQSLSCGAVVASQNAHARPQYSRIQSPQLPVSSQRPSLANFLQSWLLSKQGVPGSAVTTGRFVGAFVTTGRLVGAFVTTGFFVGASVTTGRFEVGFGVTNPEVTPPEVGFVTGFVTGLEVTDSPPEPSSQVPQLLRQLNFIHPGLFSHSPASAHEAQLA